MASNSPQPPAAAGLFIHCRPGFEADCAAELAQRGASAGLHGYTRAAGADAFLTYHLTQPADAEGLLAELGFSTLVFARDVLALHAIVEDLPEGDRAGPVVAALRDAPRLYSGLSIEHPDTNEGKAVSRFISRFRRPLESALESAGIRFKSGAPAPSLHLIFPDSGRAYLAFSFPRHGAPWPMGIPRLRFPRSAPSRSTLKLEEAFKLFVDASALKPGMSAVDLGAAPGGWTWQFVQRGIHVTAVDNGPMDPALMASGLVDHQRLDAFRFRPPKRVDWLVCDMVEKPSRVAALIAQWLTRGDCRQAIFNLKLPMKKRHAAVERALTAIEAATQQAGMAVELRCKQLYHDREEVTVHALVRPRRESR